MQKKTKVGLRSGNKNYKGGVVELRRLSKTTSLQHEPAHNRSGSTTSPFS